MGILSGITNWIGGIVGNEYASSKNNERYKDTEEYLALNKPSWTVQGLRDAGINPMVAVMNGSIGSSSAHNTASSYAPPEIMKGTGSFSYRQRDRELAEMQMMEANTSKAISEAETSEKLGKLYDAQSSKAIEEIRKLARDNDWADKNKDMYDLMKSEEAMKTLGPILYALSRLTRNSASGNVNYPQLYDKDDSK